MNFETIDASYVIIKKGEPPVRIVLQMRDNDILVQKETLLIGGMSLLHLYFSETEHFSFGEDNIPAGCIPISKEQALLSAALRFNQRTAALL
jgi:hypothetical protein